MELLAQPQLLSARVFHARLAPRRNAFAYRVYYLALDVDQLDASDPSLQGQGLALERFGLHSFYRRDHGARDGSSLRAWAEALLRKEGLEQRPQRMILVTLPRVLGFVFNPVSFWFCFNAQGQRFAVIAEVNNTFGQTRAYVCAPPPGNAQGGSAQSGSAQDGSAQDGSAQDGSANDGSYQDKDFVVSPFLRPEGRYRFGFALSQAKLGVAIDLSDCNGKRLLTTRLAGRFQPLTRARLAAAFVRHPMVTAKVVGLIHWQAVKLLAKGLRFFGGPSAYAAASASQHGTTKHG